MLQEIQQEFDDTFFQKLKNQNDDFRRHVPKSASSIISYYGKDTGLDIFYERMSFFFEYELSELAQVYFLIHYHHIRSIIDEAYRKKREVDYDKISFLFFMGVSLQKIDFSFEMYQNQLANFSTVAVTNNHLAILEYVLACRLSLRLSQNASDDDQLLPEASSDCHPIEDFCFNILQEHLDLFLSMPADRQKTIISFLSILIKLSFTHDITLFLKRIPKDWMHIDHPTIQAILHEIDLFITEEEATEAPTL